MDAAKVAMLAMSAGLFPLPPKLAALAEDPAWWERLEATPEHALDADQRALIAALGVELGSNDDDDDDPDEDDDVE